MGTTWSPVIVLPPTKKLTWYWQTQEFISTNIKPFQASQVIAQVFNAYVEKKINLKTVVSL